MNNYQVAINKKDIQIQYNNYDICINRFDNLSSTNEVFELKDYLIIIDGMFVHTITNDGCVKNQFIGIFTIEDIQSDDDTFAIKWSDGHIDKMKFNRRLKYWEKTS